MLVVNSELNIEDVIINKLLIQNKKIKNRIIENKKFEIFLNIFL